MTIKMINGQGRPACPKGYWALYEQADFNEMSGSRILVGNQSAPDLKALGFDNQTSSIWHRTDGAVAIYEDREFKGTVREVGGGNSNLAETEMSTTGGWYTGGATVSNSWDNKVSSVKLSSYPSPVPPPWVVKDGVYKVTHVATGNVLEVKDGSRSNEAAVQLGEDNGTDAQRWRVTAVQNGGECTLTNVGSGKVVDIPGADPAAEVRLHQFTNFGQNHQKWWIQPTEYPGEVTDAYERGVEKWEFWISSHLTGRHLEPDGESVLMTCDANDDDSQKWRLTPA